MKSSGVESWLGCLGRFQSLTIGMKSRSGWMDPLQTSVFGQKPGGNSLFPCLFSLFFRRSSAVSDPTGWGVWKSYPHTLWLQVASPQKATFSLIHRKLSFFDNCKRARFDLPGAFFTHPNGCLHLAEGPLREVPCSRPSRAAPRGIVWGRGFYEGPVSRLCRRLLAQ